MKILKSGNGLRVVEKYAYTPKEMTYGGRAFMQKYYQLQRNSYWGMGWMSEEESLNPHEWDFKWSEEYLANWK